MKTRKIIAYILSLVLLMGMLAGCGKEDEPKATKSRNEYEDKQTEFQEDTEPSKVTQPTKATEPNKPTLPQPTLPPQMTEPTNPPSEPDCEHNPKEWIMAATCTYEGARMQRCEKCGYILSSEKIAVLPHNNEWVTETAATCEKEGVKYQQCKDCKEIFIYIQTEKEPHTPDITGLKCKNCYADIS